MTDRNEGAMENMQLDTEQTVTLSHYCGHRKLVIHQTTNCDVHRMVCELLFVVRQISPCDEWKTSHH